MQRMFATLIAIAFGVLIVAEDANAYYHAQLGRFVNRDPIGYRGGTKNLYEYVSANPIRSTDPLGLRCCRQRPAKPKRRTCPKRRCGVESGPTFTPSGDLASSYVSVIDPARGQLLKKRSVTFVQTAVFRDDPANGYYPECCVVAQNIKKGEGGSWKEDSAANQGFPNSHYGDRGKPEIPGVSGYYDMPNGQGAANQATGRYYYGTDTPETISSDNSTWYFELVVVDICAENPKQADGSRLANAKIDWSKATNPGGYLLPPPLNLDLDDIDERLKELENANAIDSR